ncbi:hypothetical protein COY05_03500 [Candidatus Peregrinibacteria bacterium CG_4_10_14_0_2_um_filter_38_24]|nr:MAG: hypothetical protein COY05_03500 [Candidatus Peregrinibacteria bacterium CG_4_10_14_0_2_um_filter_38_24]PJC38658.1 MAG: hypothetical protein CO044_03810 [Candidatus Peregrinibacteria bacterium CG_4_9_14_0_2_um_filter_38_9]
MADLRIIQGGKDDSEDTTPESEKPTVAEMEAKGLPEQEQRVLLLRGKAKAGKNEVLGFASLSQRIARPGEIPQITTIAEIERRAMAAIAQRAKPKDSNK